ncbi:MAG: hypothetical protein ACK5LY_10760 [Lachnospirales bacterium]
MEKMNSKKVDLDFLKNFDLTNSSKNNFNKNNSYFYEKLIDITEILTNGNIKLVEEIKELIFEYDSFCNKRQAFCENLVDDFNNIYEAKRYLPLIYGYWCGGARYDDRQYCAYIGWDFKAKELVDVVQKILNSINANINIKGMEFINEKFIDNVFSEIDELLKKNFYSLLSLKVEQNSFFLFIVPLKSLAKIKMMAYDMELDFNDVF